MKKAIVLMMLLLVPFALASEEVKGLPKNCYQNYTAVVCGFQDILNLEAYCSGINLTVDDCYTEGDNLTVIFSGISYFKMPGDISRLLFNFYSRNWAWTGNQQDLPLPENSTISQINDTTFVVVSPLPGKKVESAQVTVPACYSQFDVENREKTYPRTQAGKICRIKSAEVPQEEIVQPVEKTVEQMPEKSAGGWGMNSNGILLAAAVIIIIVAVFVLRARKPKAAKK